MKKGFTLVEMLIVVVVLVTLMSITFRLSSLGDDQTRRNRTISRMQRLENCLSGFYAAYGTYPPVELHGSRDYDLGVNNQTGIQLDSDQETERKVELRWYQSTGSHGIGTETEKREWKQVRAACYSQPIAACSPVPDGYQTYIEAQVKLNQKRNSNSPTFSDGYSGGGAASRYSSSEKDWRNMQLFQFGVMSYLLPRYFFMLNAGSGADIFFRTYAQWTDNNSLPADPLGSGNRFSSWQDLRQIAKRVRAGNDPEARARLANIASQAVCARWLPNLEKSCIVSYPATTTFYGIDIYDDNSQSFSEENYNGMSHLYGQDGSYYVLSSITMVDGWRNEFFYYSPKPYQNYVLWSAGPNERTFPPWISRKDLDAGQNKCVGVWTEDDIVHMSN